VKSGFSEALKPNIAWKERCLQNETDILETKMTVEKDITSETNKAFE